MRILVTGAKGMLGSDLIPILQEQHHAVFLTDIEELDITRLEDVRKYVKKEKPEVIINCAAYTQVDNAEAEREQAFLLNASAVRNLALVSREQVIDLCHISTDYIFNGEKKSPYVPDDTPDPINVYGDSKLAGEKYIKELCRTYYIIRTSWLYGKNGPNFVHTMIKLAQSQPEIRVVHDQIGSPTWTVTLAGVIAQLIITKRYGVYHATDETYHKGISWYQFAQEIISTTGLPATLIPITTEQFPRPARRPKNSVLDVSSIKSILSHPLPSWQESLSCFLRTLKSL